MTCPAPASTPQAAGERPASARPLPGSAESGAVLDPAPRGSRAGLLQRFAQASPQNLLSGAHGGAGEPDPHEAERNHREHENHQEHSYPKREPGTHRGCPASRGRAGPPARRGASLPSAHLPTSRSRRGLDTRRMSAARVLCPPVATTTSATRSRSTSSRLAYRVGGARHAAAPVARGAFRLSGRNRTARDPRVLGPGGSGVGERGSEPHSGAQTPVAMARAGAPRLGTYGGCASPDSSEQRPGAPVGRTATSSGHPALPTVLEGA